MKANKDKATKTWVQIYNDVDFIKQNHSKLFPSEIIDRIDISYLRLKRIAAELNLELLDLVKTEAILIRAPYKKRKYTKRKKSLWERIKNRLAPIGIFKSV